MTVLLKADTGPAEATFRDAQHGDGAVVTMLASAARHGVMARAPGERRREGLTNVKALSNVGFV